jgi:phosphate uptake regulator
MVEKLTLKTLSAELEQLRELLGSMEKGLERKLETALKLATDKLHTRLERTDGQLAAVHWQGGAVDVCARRRLIAELAYLRAERRGFCGGSEEQDWLEAELEVDQMLLDGWIKEGDQKPAEPGARKKKSEIRQRAI